MKKKSFILVALLLVLAFSQAAFGGLAQVGPINPLNGFPQWYMDTNGVTLELPTPPFGDGVGLVPPTFIFGPLTPASNAFSVKIGFDTEAFYFIARARAEVGPIDGAGNGQFGRLTFLVGLEASFLNLVPVDGEQMVFSRLRLVLPGNKVLPVGTYTLQHPYGTDRIVVDATGVAKNRAIAFTRDIGVIPLNFAGALAGDVGPFLISTNPALAAVPQFPALALTNPAFANGWIGDGFTPTGITGSPIGFNKIRLTGPAGVDLDGAGRNFIEITQFELVSGHKFAGAVAGNLTVDRLTYSRTAAGLFFDIFAKSTTGAVVTAQVAPAPAAAAPLAEGLGVLAGNFFGHVAATGAVPASIAVTSTLGAGAPFTVLKAPVDKVTISQASFNPLTKVLTVTAASSDVVGKPALTVATPALGALVAGVAKNFPLNAAPTTVTVSSAAGGSATADVNVLAIAGAAPLPANALPVANFTFTPTTGRIPLLVTFTNTSAGAPTTFAWNFGDGNTATVASPTHTFATAGIFPVSMTATNANGSTTITKRITVTSGAAPAPAPAPAPVGK